MTNLRSILALHFLIAALASGCNSNTASTPADGGAPDARSIQPNARDGAPVCADVGGPAATDTDCHVFCDATLRAGCAGGPDGGGCVTLCERALAACNGRVRALRACMGTTPAFTCGADGQVASTSCGAELDCVRSCIASAPAQ